MTVPGATAQDHLFMSRALQLAERGRYTTTPNPRVGCVIVDSTGQIVGEGFHRKAGEGHAEVMALAEAKNKAHGASAYVTLEPCSHFGRTPPCADALVKAGIARVVCAMTDPNPAVSGRGIQRLRDAGLEVVTDVMAAQAEQLNAGFNKRMRTGLPLVRVKLAASLDGKVALSNGVSQWITGAQARRDVQRWRAQSCAILTGRGTVEYDDPSLLVRPEQAQLDDYPLENIRQPLRVVVDSKLSLRGEHKLFNDGFPLAVAHDAQYQPSFTGNVQSIALPAFAQGVDLRRLLEILAKQHYINEVLVEAGGTLAGSFIAERLADEVLLYQAPKLLGNTAQDLVQLPQYTALAQCPSLKLRSVRQFGADVGYHFDLVSTSDESSAQ